MNFLARVTILASAVMASSAGAAVITPNVNAAASTGISSPIRNVARVLQEYVDSSFLGDITSPTYLTGISFRLPTSATSYAPNYTFPSEDLPFTQYDITLSQASAASQTAATLASTTFADNMLNPEVVRSGALTIPKGSFTTTADGPGPTGSQPFTYFIPFTTPYLINPGQDLVVLIRQGGYSATTTEVAWNYETYNYTNGTRVSTAGVTATADNAPTSDNDVLKFAFTTTALPEPASFGTLLLGIGTFLSTRRKSQ